MPKITTRQVYRPGTRAVEIDDPYADAQNQRLVAEAMRARAIQPLDQHYESTEQNLARGLTQLGHAFLARRALQGADKAQATADEGGRQGVAAAIARLTSGQDPSTMKINDVDGGPGTPVAGGIAGGIQKSQDMHAALDPLPARQGQAVLSQALLERAMPKAPAPSEFASGGDGLIYDKTTGAVSRQPDPRAAANKSDLEVYLGLTPEKQADAIAYAKAQRPEAAPFPVTPVTIASPTSPSGAVVVDGRTGQPIGDTPVPAPNAADSAKKTARMSALQSSMDAVTRVQGSSDTLDEGGGFIEGRLPAMGEKTQDFDGAVAQLLSALQAAIRVPGIGSQSNLELQALMNALPLRTQEKKVRDNQITGIITRLNGIIEREKAVPDGPDAATPPINPAAPPPTAPKVTKVLNGVTYTKMPDGSWEQN